MTKTITPSILNFNWTYDNAWKAWVLYNRGTIRVRRDCISIEANHSWTSAQFAKLYEDILILQSSEGT